MLRTAVDRLLKNDALRCAKGAISTLSRSPLIACKSSVCVCDHVIRQALAPSLFHDPPRCWRIAGSWAPAEPVAETAASPSPPRPGPRVWALCASTRATAGAGGGSLCRWGGREATTTTTRASRQEQNRAAGLSAMRVFARYGRRRRLRRLGSRMGGGGAATTSTRLATALPQL